MTYQKYSSARLGKNVFAVLMASSAVLTVGCANMATIALDSSTGSAQPMTMKGSVHGGNQPVAGATVKLYAAGQSQMSGSPNNGPGSDATLLATTTTSNDGGANFAFTKAPFVQGQVYPNTGSTYSCNSAGFDSLLYVISTGGNTTGNAQTPTNNSAAVFIAPVGYCSAVTASSRVFISEVTTAAMALAVGQFINPQTESVGNDGIGAAYTALGNAFKAVNNLVDPNTGNAVTFNYLNGANTPGGVNVTNITVRVTPNTAKLNTIADILSACVNQPVASGSSCSTLFASAVPPLAARTSQPTATFPAATDTLQAALYMAINPTNTTTANRTALYNLIPASGSPYQPTITSVPTDWTVGVTFTSNDVCAGGTNFIASPKDINVDVVGNIWFANQGSLSAVTSNGAPLTCVVYNGTSLAGGVVDIAGGIWYGDNSSNMIYRYDPSTQSTKSITTTAPILAITVDGSGATFYSTSVGGVGNVYRINNASSSSGNTTTLISNTVGSNPVRMFPDTSGDIWVASGSNFVSELATATGGTNFIGGYATTQFSLAAPTFGVTVGPSNNVRVTSQNTAALLTKLTPSGSSFAVAPGFPTASNAGGMNNPTGVTIDGARNNWIANGMPEGTGNTALSVIDNNGVSITADGSANGGYQQVGGSILAATRTIIIDQVGNVWLTNDNASNSITQIVGAAVPIYQPFSLGLQQGRFQSIP